MKSIPSVPIDPIIRYAKYKAAMGDHYEEIINACIKWENLCLANFTSRGKLAELLNSEPLKILEKAEKDLNTEGRHGVLKDFFIDMINGQHSDLVIPYLAIIKDFPDDIAGIHVGMLGSSEEIFDVINP